MTNEEKLKEIINEVHNWVVCGAITTPEDMARNFNRIEEITNPDNVEVILSKEVITPYSSLIKYIGEKIRHLESKTKSASVLQFTDAPQGMAMILRLYVAKYDKEYQFPDIILMTELDSMDSLLKERARIDVLFDEIHRALNSIQIISGDKAKGAGIIH